MFGTDNRLVRISMVPATEEPELTSAFWTTIASVTNADRSFRTPAEIKELLSLPRVPASATIGGVVIEGARILMGETPENACGNLVFTRSPVDAKLKDNVSEETVSVVIRYTRGIVDNLDVPYPWRFEDAEKSNPPQMSGVFLSKKLTSNQINMLDRVRVNLKSVDYTDGSHWPN